MTDIRTADKWDILWIDTAHRFAKQSKDRSVQVGCVIVTPDKRTLVSQGWNGFPRNVDDTIDARNDRPEKYYWVVHAELNAILNHARTGGTSLVGCVAYINWSPNPGVCSHCLASLHQAGIIEVIGPDRKFAGSSTQTHYCTNDIPDQMSKETGTKRIIVDYKLGE